MMTVYLNVLRNTLLLNGIISPKTKIDIMRYEPTADRRWGEGLVARVGISLRGKQPTIECENLIQVIFIAGVKESIIFPQRMLLFNKYFSRFTERGFY